jgi:hypothetical protein
MDTNYAQLLGRFKGLGEVADAHSEKRRRGGAIPTIIAMIVAILGMAGILFEDFGSSGSQGSNNAKMATGAALARAGAIEIPSEPPAGQSLAPPRVTVPTIPRSQ